MTSTLYSPVNIIGDGIMTEPGDPMNREMVPKQVKNCDPLC